MENQNRDEQPAPMEPTPVWVVNMDRFYAGAIPTQYYMLLWFSLALLIGSLLPWSNDGGYSLLQLILLVASVGCTARCVANIRGPRASLGPVFVVEMLATVLLILHFTVATRDLPVQRTAAKNEINAQIAANQGAEPRDTQLRAEFRQVDDKYDVGILDLYTAPMSTFLTDYGSSERSAAETKFNRFGLGFHFAWWTANLLLVYLVATIVLAVVTAKPKEAPAETRRKSRLEARDEKAAAAETVAK